MQRIGGLSDAGDAGVRRPRRQRAGHQPHDREPRAVLGGRHPGGQVARRRVGDRHARGEGRCCPITKDLRRFAKTAKPVGATAAALLESLPARQGHRAPARLRLLPSGRHQRLRLGRPLPAGAPDRQHVLELLHDAGRGLLGQLRLLALRPSASAASAAGSDPVLRRTAAALQGKDPDSVAALPQMTATPQPQKKRSKTAPKAVATPAPTPAATPTPAADADPAAEPTRTRARRSSTTCSGRAPDERPRLLRSPATRSSSAPPRCW